MATKCDADSRLSPAARLVAHFQENPPKGVTLDLMVVVDRHGCETANGVAVLWIQRTGEKGTGFQAMSELCKRADEWDISLELSVTPKDKRALVPFYRQFGFSEIPSDDDYFAMRRPSPSMKQLLTPSTNSWQPTSASIDAGAGAESENDDHPPSP